MNIKNKVPRGTDGKLIFKLEQNHDIGHFWEIVSCVKVHPDSKVKIVKIIDHFVLLVDEEKAFILDSVWSDDVFNGRCEGMVEIWGKNNDS